MPWRVIWAFFKRDGLEALSYRGSYALRLIGLLISLVTLLFMSRFIGAGSAPLLERYGGDYLSFGLVGVVLLNLQHVLTSAYPTTIRQAQMAGTLEAMLATPTASWVVLLCAPTYQIATAFVGAVAVMVGGGLLLGLRFDQANMPALVLALVLCPVVFASLGFFAATLTMLFRRSDPVSLFLSSASALVGGVFYPTAVLPPWLQHVGALLPITHALEIVRRAMFAGAPTSTLAGPLAALAVACVVITPLGLLSFSRVVRHTRRDGSLSHY